jgi:hypothetical protein
MFKGNARRAASHPAVSVPTARMQVSSACDESVVVAVLWLAAVGLEADPDPAFP